MLVRAGTPGSTGKRARDLLPVLEGLVQTAYQSQLIEKSGRITGRCAGVVKGMTRDNHSFDIT
jgi:hypothetical protein